MLNLTKEEALKILSLIVTHINMWVRSIRREDDKILKKVKEVIDPAHQEKVVEENLKVIKD